MLLEVSDLNAWYGDLKILQGVNFTLAENELVSIVGSNGAGKTTLLKSVAGLIPSRKGTLLLRGQDISRLQSYELVELGIVLVPEGRDLFPHMTVLENIELGACSKRASSRKGENMRKVLELMPVLSERRRQLAGTLSGGEQQMVAIARGLMGEPTVLLLDEPSLGLSPILVNTLLSLIASLHREEHIGIVLVEQNVKHALSISDRACVMENGTMVFEGNALDILNDERTRRAYLGR